MNDRKASASGSPRVFKKPEGTLGELLGGIHEARM